LDCASAISNIGGCAPRLSSPSSSHTLASFPSKQHSLFSLTRTHSIVLGAPAARNFDRQPDPVVMDKKSFPCHVCGAVLTRSTILSEHLMSHDDERPHECSFCQRAFVRKSDCKQHEATHFQKPQYACRWTTVDGQTVGCGKEFHRKRDLERHHRRRGAASCGRQVPTVQFWTPGETHLGFDSPLLATEMVDRPYTEARPNRVAAFAAALRERRRIRAKLVHLSGPVNPRLETSAASWTKNETVVSKRRPSLYQEKYDRYSVEPQRPLYTDDVSFEVDALWITAIAAFRPADRLNYMLNNKVEVPLPYSRLASDTHWRLLGRTQRTIAAVVRSNGARNRIDLLYALYLAALLMGVLTRPIGETAGYSSHYSFYMALRRHLDRDYSIFLEEEPPASVEKAYLVSTTLHTWDAVDRYQVRSSDHFDTTDIEVLELAEEHLVRAGHTRISTGPARLVADQTAVISSFRQRYGTISSLAVGHSEALLKDWYGQTSLRW
jgi:hypothetical protein